MKNRATGIFVLFIVVVLLEAFSDKHFCPDAIDLEGTTWLYIDAGRTYPIHFAPNARVVTGHPNDVTPDNDRWRQIGDIMQFYYNDKYAWYIGTIYGGDSIIGKARNVADSSWSFKMYRFSDTTKVNVLK